jgi:hypothetical protein
MTILVKDIDMKMLIVAVTIVVGAGTAFAETPDTTAAAPIVLLDSTGKIAARPLNDNLVLVTLSPAGVVAPAFIRPTLDEDGKAASGLAIWASGGSVLFASADCTTGAHVFSLGNAGVRATSQVETPAGIVLYVGAIGTTTTIAVRSILYGNGCRAVTVQQNGVVPVDATLNLTTAYPPPLSFK